MTKKNFLFAILSLVVLAAVFVGVKNQQQKILSEKKATRVWQVKSVDTMKYSRDLTLKKLNDDSFDQTIDLQMRLIAQSGANYVAIGTPYDEKFIPFLRRWVTAARHYGLNVWFRGNFSGWEGWFGAPKNLTREQHLELTRKFIRNHPDLFRNGDAFTPCTECENGGPGDPRYKTDVAGFRKFMIDESLTASQEFKRIDKNVAINLASMNYDVAKLVMDGPTVGAMGNLIVVDHYVKTPQKLADDVKTLAQNTGAKVMLGEFGAPIPDIHGNFTETQQSQWIDEALRLVGRNQAVIGLNYWVSFGGTTGIFNLNGTLKPAAYILGYYFKLSDLTIL